MVCIVRLSLYIFVFVKTKFLKSSLITRKYYGVYSKGLKYLSYTELDYYNLFHRWRGENRRGDRHSNCFSGNSGAHQTGTIHCWCISMHSLKKKKKHLINFPTYPNLLPNLFFFAHHRIPHVHVPVTQKNHSCHQLTYTMIDKFNT